MGTIFFQILFLILAYLVGAIPFGLIIALLKGHDIRKEGSGNIGATNVGRIIGKKYAILTYILDMLKGFVFVFLFNYALLPKEWCVINPLLYGVLANIGHAYSIFLGFKGGKSVSCGSGAIAGYCPLLLLFMLIVFFIIKKMGKLVSLSSLITTLITFLLILIISLSMGDFFNFETGILKLGMVYSFNCYAILCCGLICTLIYIKHIPNIKRLIKKEEKPINY